MDIYPNEGKLEVIEVNTAFVDGWGIALNLSRAAGQPLDASDIFPSKFLTTESQYRPELQLLIGELAIGAVEIEDLSGCDDPVYVYGRVTDPPENVLPRRGKEFDDKRLLAEFSRTWDSSIVTTPKSYSVEQGDTWQDVPDDVYIKFVDKSSDESEKARFSVKKGKPTGKAPFLKRAFNEGKLIAQDTIPEYWQEIQETQKATQLVVLNQGNFLTGYVQYGNGCIINDNSVHAPLLFKEPREET